MTEKRARELLVAAIDRACVARGEAQYLMGLRCGSESPMGTSDERRIYEKEMRRWDVVGSAESAAHRWITTYARIVRQSRRTASAGGLKRKRLVKARKAKA